MHDNNSQIMRRVRDLENYMSKQSSKLVLELAASKCDQPLVTDGEESTNT